MIAFQGTDLAGVLIVDPEAINDDRGSFARTYCRREFEQQGVAFVPVQSSVSFNVRAGTLRGLHYQGPPHEEAKLVRCTAGAAYDVAVDLRPGSSTHGEWVGVELSATNMRGLLIPPGVAHGFQTLADGTEMLYLISEFYEPDSQRGIRWDDPHLAIQWPKATTRVISERDRGLPLLGG